MEGGSKVEERLMEVVARTGEVERKIIKGGEEREQDGRRTEEKGSNTGKRGTGQRPSGAGGFSVANSPAMFSVRS